MSVAHVVLFDLRPDLDAEGKRRFREALVKALAAIPAVRRCRVGRRLTVGARYEQSNGAYAFVAAIEFDDVTGLRSYLEHPAHAELGALFWSSTARSLVLDFELSGEDVTRVVEEWS